MRSMTFLLAATVGAAAMGPLACSSGGGGAGGGSAVDAASIAAARSVAEGEPNALAVRLGERIEAELTQEEIDYLFEVSVEDLETLVTDPLAVRALGAVAPELGQQEASLWRLVGAATAHAQDHGCARAVDNLEAAAEEVKNSLPTRGADGAILKASLLVGAFGDPFSRAVAVGVAFGIAAHAVGLDGLSDVTDAIGGLLDCVIDTVEASDCGLPGGPCCTEGASCREDGFQCLAQRCVETDVDAGVDAGVDAAPLGDGGSPDAGSEVATCDTSVDLMQTDGTPECCRIQGGFRMVTLGQESFTRPSTWSVQGAVDVPVTVERATVSFCSPLRGVVGHTQFAVAASTDHPNQTDFPGATLSGAGGGGTVCYEPNLGGWELHGGITQVVGEDEWAGTLSLAFPAHTTAAYFEDGGVQETIELPEQTFEIPFEVTCTYATPSDGFGVAGSL